MSVPLETTIESLNEEMLLLNQLLDRSRNQQRRQRYFKEFQQIKRLYNLAPADSISKLHTELSLCITRTQQKMTSHIVSRAMSVHRDCMKVFNLLTEICIKCEKVGIDLVLQLRGGSFGPLYSVLLATNSRILLTSNTIRSNILQDSTCLASYLKRVSVLRPEYSDLISLKVLDLNTCLSPMQYEWHVKHTTVQTNSDSSEELNGSSADLTQTQPSTKLSKFADTIDSISTNRSTGGNVAIPIFDLIDECEPQFNASSSRSSDAIVMNNCDALCFNNQSITTSIPTTPTINDQTSAYKHRSSEKLNSLLDEPKKKKKKKQSSSEDAIDDIFSSI